MAYDEDLADRIRELVGRERGLTEEKRFGGRAVLAGGNMGVVASGAMVREAAISEGIVGARELWVGYVELPPASVSAVHHHGEAESAIYVISGHARFLCGETLDDELDAGPGDFVWVPPHVLHV